MKARIDDEARRRGRTQSQVAEALIDLALDRENLLGQALELKYGKELGALLIGIGDVMREVGTECRLYETQDAFEAIKPASWMKGAYAFDQVRQAVDELLKHRAPTGAPDVPKQLNRERGAEYGRRAVRQRLAQQKKEQGE